MKYKQTANKQPVLTPWGENVIGAYTIIDESNIIKAGGMENFCSIFARSRPLSNDFRKKLADK